MDRKPLIVAPFDAELFGHWWFEGPIWLDQVFRKIASGQCGVRPVTLSEYLEEYPTNEVTTPCMSSWGAKGFNEVWLNGGGLQGGTPGVFTDSGLRLGAFASHEVILADLDGDGDLDAFVGNDQGQPNKVWLNQSGR